MMPAKATEAASATELLNRLATLAMGGGARDKGSLEHFAETVRRLRELPGASGRFRAKVSSAGGWAALLFSSWRHARYDWPDRSGAVRIRAFIAEDLTAARQLAPGVTAP